MTVTPNPVLVVMVPRAHGSIQIGSILLCFPQMLHWDEVIAYFLTDTWKPIYDLFSYSSSSATACHY